MSAFLHFNNAELSAFYLSIKVALYSSLTALPLAIGIGYGIARFSFRGKSVVESILHLPLVMPPVTTGYLLLLFLGTQGPVGRVLYEVFGIRLPFTFAAAVISSIIVSFPLMVRSIRIAMEMGQQDLEEASYMLGHGPVFTFSKITLPLAVPGIISGFILAFARSLGEFGATITFAGNIEGETQTVPLAIYAHMQVPGMEGATLRLVMVSALIALAAMIIAEWLLKRMKQI